MFKILWEYNQTSDFLCSEIYGLIGEVGNWKDGFFGVRTHMHFYHKSGKKNFVYLWIKKSCISD